MRLRGNSTSSSLVPKNALASIDWMPSSNVTLDSSAQPENTSCLMLSTQLGITTFVKEPQNWNALFPIVLHFVVSNFKVCKCAHQQYASSFISTMLSGIISTFNVKSLYLYP